MPAFKIITKAAVAFYDELFNITIMGFATLIACLVFLIAPVILINQSVYAALVASLGQLGFVLISIIAYALASLPGAVAVGGLYAACQKTVRGEGMKWRHYWDGVKEFGLRTWLIWLGMLAGFGIVAINIWFYNSAVFSFSPIVSMILTPLWFIGAVVWGLIHIYVQPYLMELVEPKIKFIYRNSLFMVLLHPVATLILAVVTILVLALSVIIPILLLFGPAFVIILGLSAVRVLTEGVEEKAQKYEEEEREKAQDDETTTPEL